MDNIATAEIDPPRPVSKQVSRRAARLPELMIEQGYWPELKTAQLLGITVRTLRRLQVERRGPPRVKFAQRNFYRPRDVREWLADLKPEPQGPGPIMTKRQERGKRLKAVRLARKAEAGEKAGG